MKLKTLLEKSGSVFWDCIEKLSNELESGCLYSMKIKEQTRKLDAGCTWVRQGEADVVWIWFSKSIILQLVANVWLAYEIG